MACKDKGMGREADLVVIAAYNRGLESPGYCRLAGSFVFSSLPRGFCLLAGLPLPVTLKH